LILETGGEDFTVTLGTPTAPVAQPASFFSSVTEETTRRLKTEKSAPKK
jgi:hypothetical protein